jgi:hypothetical protein
MAEENDHRIKRVVGSDDDAEEKIYKLVRIGSERSYSPPSFEEAEPQKAIIGVSAAGESRIYCNCHTVCGCDTVDSDSCGCHNVCTCDNVCTCNTHATSTPTCTCNTVEICTCNAVCVCNAHCSCNSQHYWYPN